MFWLFSKAKAKDVNVTHADKVVVHRAKRVKVVYAEQSECGHVWLQKDYFQALKSIDPPDKYGRAGHKTIAGTLRYLIDFHKQATEVSSEQSRIHFPNTVPDKATSSKTKTKIVSLTKGGMPNVHGKYGRVMVRAYWTPYDAGEFKVFESVVDAAKSLDVNPSQIRTKFQTVQPLQAVNYFSTKTNTQYALWYEGIITANGTSLYRDTNWVMHGISKEFVESEFRCLN